MSQLEPIDEPVDARAEPSTLPRGHAVVDPSLAARLRSEHSRVFEVEAVATPTGPELLTRDVPNVGEDALGVLGEDGVVEVGTTVSPGTLLVGKVTPRGGETPSSEEKLLRAIFGEAAGEVRDTSLRAPPGCFGVVTRAGLEPGGEGVEKRAMVEVSWERPLDVGDVLLVDDEEVLVAAIEPIGADLAWSGGASTVSVAKAAMARDRIHARSIGPYSVVTQQPLEGRESFGGQRVTTEQMEILAHRAPWIAWEMLTVKADDVIGRTRVYESLVKQENPDVIPAGAPASASRPRPAGGGSGKPDIFSFFEKPAVAEGEVPRAEPEAVKTVLAHLRAMGLELQLGAERVGAVLRSAEAIREASHGEVRKPETMNYRTYKPEAEGLFCPRIFGPVDDYECACGKYKRMKHRGTVCEKCGVEVIGSKVRRERFAHVELASPCLHPLLVEAVGLLLGLEEEEVRDVAAGRSVLREDGGEGWTVDPHEGEPVAGGPALWEALESLDLEAIDAMETGPRADLAGALADAELPATALMVKVVPVLPPDLRPLVKVPKGWATSHLNDLYRRVVNRNNRLRRLVELDAPVIILVNERLKLQEAIDELMINGWLEKPVRNPEGKPLRALAMATDDLFSQRVFEKAVDYSGVAHLVADPTLSPGDCRVPRSMLKELYRPWAYGILEQRGYVVTIKSAKRAIEADRPEGLAAIEEASEGAPVLLMAGATMVGRHVRAWGAPAIAVDPSTARTLGSREVTLHVPLTHEAGLQCTTLEDGPSVGSPTDGGWLVDASRDGELTRAAFEAAVEGSRDDLDDPWVALALGRPPEPIAAQEVEDFAGWDRDRRQRVHRDVSERNAVDEDEPEQSPYLDRSVDELELSIRTANVLQNKGVSTIRELCRCTEAELLKTKNCGRKSLKELKEILAQMGLSLGMRDV